MAGGFSSAITSALPSMSRQLGSSGITVAGVCNCMFANTALLVECRLPLVVVNDSGKVMSSCWRMFSRFTSRHALYAVMCLCRMFLSTLIMFYVGRLHDFIRGGNCIGLILLNGCFQIQVMVTVWRLTQTFVQEDLHLCLSKVFCTKQRLLNLRCDHILVD